MKTLILAVAWTCGVVAPMVGAGSLYLEKQGAAKTTCRTTHVPKYKWEATPNVCYLCDTPNQGPAYTYVEGRPNWWWGGSGKCPGREQEVACGTWNSYGKSGSGMKQVRIGTEAVENCTTRPGEINKVEVIYPDLVTIHSKTEEAQAQVLVRGGCAHVEWSSEYGKILPYSGRLCNGEWARIAPTAGADGGDTLKVQVRL